MFVVNWTAKTVINNRIHLQHIVLFLFHKFVK
jgi:hypothetical protein